MVWYSEGCLKIWELFETFKKYSTLPRTASEFSEKTAQKHCGKIKEIVKDNSGPSGPLYKF